MIENDSKKVANYLEPMLNIFPSENREKDREAEKVFNEFISRQTQWQILRNEKLRRQKSAEPIKRNQPLVNQVTKVIHKKKMQNAIKSGNPSHYYRPCL